ncbi:hypothetical protein [Shewanella cutis]|uniref:Uncharacterized protein n=1 Tax=Shewanella cutis TaxID=2766780 RepID=A0ABS9QW65_9GAMM|nr:hypothetical protein [Shewanella sp. PS-2]MCG9964608.1 hypothetical protein [Shewanella sp. PS-2]
MDSKERLKLLNARVGEIKNAILEMKLVDVTTAECDAASREIVGIYLDDYGANLKMLSAWLYAQSRRGSMILDEAITHLNNLPLGLRIADLQRAEVLKAEPELAADFEQVESAEKSLERLCDEYEESVCAGKQSIEAQAYIMALEDLVSELQGKSFADSSRIGQLTVENAALKQRLQGMVTYRP